MQCKCMEWMQKRKRGVDSEFNSIRTTFLENKFLYIKRITYAALPSYSKRRHLSFSSYPDVMVKSCKFSKRCLYYFLSARSGLRLIGHLSPRYSLASLRHDGLNPQAMNQSSVFLHELSAFSCYFLGPYSDNHVIIHFIKKSIFSWQTVLFSNRI